MASSANIESISADIQILALDMDDTLLRSDKTITPQVLTLIREWRASGNRVVIATGRPPRSIPASLPEELHDIPWICYNGAEIRVAGRIVYTDLLTVEDARQIVEMAESLLPDSLMGLEIEDVLYLNRKMARPSPYQIARLRDVAIRPAAKILFFEQDFSQLDPLLDALPDGARALLSEKYGLVQIMSHSADKAEALRHLVEQWGLSMSHVVAFGDDVNDVGMVRECAIGVAVANAVPEVIEVANHVTLSNDEDGVALVIERLLQQR